MLPDSEISHSTGQGTIIKSRYPLPHSINHALSIEKLLDIGPVNDSCPAPRARIAVAKCPALVKAGRKDCHYLLGRLLDSISLQAKNEWYVTYLANGAPQLISDQGSGLSISMARTGRWLIAGVSLVAGIGIDIESIKPRTQLNEKAGFLNWKIPITDLHDFYANWTLWEASAKCVNGSVFMANNRGFEQLCQGDTRGKLAHIGDWYGLHEELGGEVYYALVLNGRSSRELSFSNQRLKDTRPWPLPHTTLARPDTNLPNQCV